MTDEPDPADVARLEQRLYDMGDQDPDPVGDASAWAWAFAAAAVVALCGAAWLFASLVMAWVMPL
jgi:fatty acid desaturase